MHISELLTRNEMAVRTSVSVVARVEPSDLQRTTPCSGWTLADLLAHMIAQHRGFAAAADGRGADLSAWQVTPLSTDAAAEYSAAAEGVLAAFAAPDLPGRTFHLPEFGPQAQFPAERAIGFHLVDYVVHGWDVACTLGLDYQLDPQVAGPALEIALAVPNGVNRIAPGAAFKPALGSAEGADRLHQILLALGRVPGWPQHLPG